MKKSLLLFSACSLLATQALASDSSVKRLLGFSADGKYVAFEQYGVQDGSGSAFSNIYALSVDENKYAAAPIHVIEDPNTATSDLAKIRKEATEKAHPLLTKLGIQAPSVKVRKLGENYLGSNFKEEGKTLSLRNRPAFAKYSYDSGSCQLLLNLIPTGIKDPLYGAETQKIKLSLNCETKWGKFENGTTKLSKVLQEDTALPSSRKNAYDYQIESVYVFDESLKSEDSIFDFTKAKIIVFIRYLAPGFEGADMRYIAVSGNFNEKSLSPAATESERN